MRASGFHAARERADALAHSPVVLAHVELALAVAPDDTGLFESADDVDHAGDRPRRAEPCGDAMSVQAVLNGDDHPIRADQWSDGVERVGRALRTRRDEDERERSAELRRRHDRVEVNDVLATQADEAQAALADGLQMRTDLHELHAFAGEREGTGEVTADPARADDRDPFAHRAALFARAGAPTG